MIIKVAAIALASLATYGHARANVVLSCSGIMDGPGIRTERAHSLSITIDPVRKIVVVGDAAPIPIQGDATKPWFAGSLLPARSLANARNPFVVSDLNM